MIAERRRRHRRIMASRSRLLVDFALERKIPGAPCAAPLISDFEYEFQMALMNRSWTTRSRRVPDAQRDLHLRERFPA